jgi:hypothetical protein
VVRARATPARSRRCLRIGEPLIAFGLAAGNDVMKLAGLDVGKVVVKCHAVIDDDGCALLELDALAETIEHGAERAVTAGVAGEDLMGEGKAVTIDHKVDDELLAVGAFITRVAAFGFGLRAHKPSKYVDGLDGGAVRMQLVEDLIERIFLQRIKADAENVGERPAPDPGRHGVLGGGRNQPTRRHHTGEPAHHRRQAAVSQNLVKPEPLPELIADMNWAGLTMLLSGDTRCINFD